MEPINQKRRASEGLEDPTTVKFFRLGDDLQCSKCGLCSSSFAPPRKNQNRSFHRHIDRHDWKTTSALRSESVDNEDLTLSLSENHPSDLKDLEEMKEAVRRSQAVENQEKFFLQLYCVRKQSSSNSSSLFNGIFQSVDYNLNSLPMNKITWKRVDTAVSRYFPATPLETVHVGDKTLTYLNPISACRRWFLSPQGKVMADWKLREPSDIFRDLYDGSVWKKMEQEGFLNEPRNLVCMIGADGFSKFRSKNLSTAGIYLIPMNLPPDQRANRKNWATLCSFPNEKLSDADLISILHCLLDRIVDDFLKLDQGVVVHDNHRAEDFLLRARIGLIVGDLIEMAELLEKTHPTGLKSCHVCSNPSSEWANFVAGNPMHLRSHQQVSTNASFIERIKKDGSIPQSHIDDACQQTGMTGRTPFFRLPYFNYMENIGIDALHNVIYGFVEDVSSEILGFYTRSTTEDNIKKIQSFDRVMKNTKVPPGTYILTRSIAHFKDFSSAEWLTVMRHGYPALLEMNIGEEKTSLLEETWSLGLELLRSTFTPVHVSLLEGRFRLFADRVWRFFQRSPLSCSLNWHLPVHLGRMIRQWGPLVYHWIWVIERLNQSCKSIIDSGNKKNVENCLMLEMTIRSDIYFFCQNLFQKNAADHDESESESDDESPSLSLSKTIKRIRNPYLWEGVGKVEEAKFAVFGSHRLKPAAKKNGTFVKASQGNQTVYGTVEQICQRGDESWVWIKVYSQKNHLTGPLGAYFIPLVSPTHVPFDGPCPYYQKFDLRDSVIEQLTISIISKETSDHKVLECKILYNILVEKFPPLHTLRVDKK